MSVVMLPLVRGIELTGEEFRRELVKMCQRIDVDPAHMAAVMSFESCGTFSPSVRNKSTGATGLIQFTKDAAEVLGTTTGELSQMTDVQQLEYVEEYFKRVKGDKSLDTLSDVYIAVFSPAFVGCPDSKIMYMKGSKQYARNSGLDINGDGNITKGDAAARVQGVLDASEGQIAVDMSEPEAVVEEVPDKPWPLFFSSPAMRIFMKLVDKARG